MRELGTGLLYALGLAGGFYLAEQLQDPTSTVRLWLSDSLTAARARRDRENEGLARWRELRTTSRRETP